MKRLIPFLPLMFVCVSAFLFVLTLAHPAPADAQRAAPPALMMGSTNYAMDWNAVAVSGGGESASTNYKLRGTIGQPAASSSSTSANYGECSGFECVVDALRLYLSIIMK
jgi:hypothetical protein